MAKRLKLKKRNGNLIDLPLGLVKKVLKKGGFAGKQLTLVSQGVAREAAKLASKGIITSTDLEKAIVKAVHNTNSIVMNRTKSITRKFLN